MYKYKFNPYFRHPKPIPRREYSTNHKVGFYNTELQCRCIRGICSEENHCTHDPTIVYSLLKHQPVDLVPPTLITTAFEQITPLANGVSGNL